MNGGFIPTQLAHRDLDRLKKYKELLDFYHGRHWEGYAKRGEKRLTFNYAKVVIDKVTSYLMSGINFGVDAVEDSDEARARAQRAESALYQVYQDNNLEQLDFDTEIDCAILGDAGYKVIWDSETKSVRITAPDVQGIYAWWVGDDTSRIWRVASKYSLTADEVEILYKVRPKGKTANIVELWTAQDFELWLDNAQVEKKPNPYGFIPFIIYPNLREPKKFWGISDLPQVMEPQRELNRAMSQLSRILELSGNPIAVLENVEESEDIAVKPGAVWNIPEDARAYLLDLLQGGGVGLHINYVDLLYRILHDISESPRAAFGGTARDLSGVALEIELQHRLTVTLNTTEHLWISQMSTGVSLSRSLLAPKPIIAPSGHTLFLTPSSSIIYGMSQCRLIYQVSMAWLLLTMAIIAGCLPLMVCGEPS